MNISELIARLEEVRNAEGDIPVALSHWDAHNSQSEVETLDMEARYIESYELSKFSRGDLEEGRMVVFF